MTATSASSSPMSDTEPMIFVDDIAAFSDDQLAQFMEKHRGPNGGFSLPVDGWEKLSPDARNQLAERLKAQQDKLSKNAANNSRPLDLDQLDARLRQVSDSRDPVPRAQRRLDSPYPEEEKRQDNICVETDCYNRLVQDGGRPHYPISLIERVSRNREKYPEIIQTFYDPGNDVYYFWQVFERQLQRWQDFRIWQIDNRDLPIDDGGYPAYVEEWNRWCLLRGETGMLAPIEAEPLCLKYGWEKSQRERRWKRRWQRERDCDSFSDYVDAVSRRLARHGFTRASKLREDHKLQDKLTTWIEYLCFEYWWLDRHKDNVQRLQPDRDRRWQELVDEKIPKPHENWDNIGSDSSWAPRQVETDRASQALADAQAEGRRVRLLTQEHGDHPSIPAEKRTQMLEAALEKLEAAQELYDSIKRRHRRIHDFLGAAKAYGLAKRNVARFTAITQWALSQVALVEAELIQQEVTEAESGTESKKRKRGQDEAQTEDGGSRRRNSGHGESRLRSQRISTGPALAAPSRRVSETEMGSNGPAQEDGSSAARTQSNEAKSCRTLRSADAPPESAQGPRRSARIATRLSRSRPAVTATASGEHAAKVTAKAPQRPRTPKSPRGPRRRAGGM